MRQAHRFSNPGGPYEGLTTIRRGKVDWSGVVRFVPEQLELPLRWRKPRRVFVNSMSDLFHESVPDTGIDQIFAVMALASQHTFQVLTKRADRMRQYFATDSSKPLSECTEARVGRVARQMARERGEDVDAPNWDMFWTWPLPNVWLGVSAEDQQRADERIPALLECPAGIRFVSAEPLLGPIDLRKWIPSPIGMEPEAVSLDWVIVGGESGPSARPCDVDWIRSIVRQCKEAGVSCFVKQLGARPLEFGQCDIGDSRTRMKLKDRKGGEPSEWPDYLRVREFPEVVP